MRPGSVRAPSTDARRTLRCRIPTLEFTRVGKQQCIETDSQRRRGFFSSQKTGFLTLATTARLLTEALNQANGGFETPSPFAFPLSLSLRGGGFEKVADENPSQESFGLLH